MEMFSCLTQESNPRGTVLIAHGYAEHHGRYGPLKKGLTEAGYDAWFFNFTGHGNAPGKRGRVDVGHLIGEHLEARETLLTMARTDKIFLFGHSMGGLISLASTILSPHHLIGTVVTAPALSPIPNTGKFVARMGTTIGRLFPSLNTIKLDETFLSRNPTVIEDYRKDPLVYNGKVPLITGASMALQGKYVKENAQILARKVLILHGSQDHLVDVLGSVEFVEASNGHAELEIVEGGYHELLNEPNNQFIHKRILNWYGSH